MQALTESANPPTPAELRRALPVLSPRGLRFRGAALASRVGALLSEGLRIGYRYGFDSGPFMAHVYANEPRGRTPLGRAIDRALLGRATCRAFREIRALAREQLEQALVDCGERAVIADLAAGPAPYLLEALATHPQTRAIACDIDPTALAQAGARARQLGVADRLRLLGADAFDRQALSRLAAERPDVVLELGLYGIYHDDRLIERHLSDLAELLGPRQIVFNVQCQNPEIEYIARVWRDHRGERCVWRLRPVEWILAWGERAGYEPVSIASDHDGIYRVGRLRRSEP